MRVEDRFWPKVAKVGPDECWEWQGATGERGYGQFWFNGRTHPAHRIAWLLTYCVPIPDDMQGCHHCDNPPCVNPAHLFIGTMSDNILDAVEKGRVVPNNRRSQTHCKHGHEYTEENTYWRPGTGHRECQRCADIKNRIKREKRAAARAALEGSAE